MKFLNKVAYELRKYPLIKKKLKDIYQFFGDILSDKKTWPSSIKQISSNESEHFFGYYDKSPWNKNENKMIYLEVKDAYKNVAPKIEAKIILKDLISGEEKEIATTRAWNVQQGCMLQWLGPNFNTNIIYNDFIDNELKAVVLDIDNGEKKVLDYPIYDIDKEGKFALTLDFYRLHRLRPGYGYSNKEDETKETKIPSGFCIWKNDLKNNTQVGIITYEQLINIDHCDSMDGAEHKVNHIMINPDGSRFMFLHRWIKNGVKNSRLLTANLDGSEIYNLSDDGMVSHCIWKNNTTILGWLRKKNSGTGYFLLEDKSRKCRRIAEGELEVDGHPSYNIQKTYFITDTYPNFKRKQYIYLYNISGMKTKLISSIYSSLKYKNDCRCDLHPRWNYSGTKICFDGSQTNKRQVYIVELENNM